jgi:MFS family permease
VLIRDFHLQPEAFVGWVGGILFIGGVLGSVLGGIAADLGHKTGKRGGLLWIAVAATILAIPAALFPIMTTITALQGLFFLLLLNGTITSVVSSTAVAVLLPNEERGATMAAFGVINALIGLSLAPIVVTLASQAMGGEQHLSQALAGTGLLTGVASFLGYLFAMRNAPRSPTQWR